MVATQTAAADGGIVVGNSTKTKAQTSATEGEVDGVKSASIFLVEDEALIRLMLADMMGELGHVVVAEASNVEIAQRLAETADFDLAILDINVAGSAIWPIAETIERRGLPFLFMSGYGSDSLPEAFRDRPVLNKPCTIQKLKQAIDRLLP
jgi:CheY-like chemotaxis protein